DPPPSVTSASGATPAATDAAPPALDPPGVFERSHGFLVTPVSGLSPTALVANSGVVVLPRMQAPAALTLSTAPASEGGTFPFIVRDPKVVGIPATFRLSFTVIGTPHRAPGLSPLAKDRSAALAASSAS